MLQSIIISTLSLYTTTKLTCFRAIINSNSLVSFFRHDLFVFEDIVRHTNLRKVSTIQLNLDILAQLVIHLVLLVVRCINLLLNHCSLLLRQLRSFSQLHPRRQLSKRFYLLSFPFLGHPLFVSCILELAFINVQLTSMSV